MIVQYLYFRLDQEGEKPRLRGKSSVVETWPEVGEEGGLWLLPIPPVLGVKFQRSRFGKATDWIENERVLSLLKKARQEELTEEPAKCHRYCCYDVVMVYGVRGTLMGPIAGEDLAREGPLLWVGPNHGA